MVFVFLLGLAVGVGAVARFYFRARRETERVEEEKAHVIEEKQIVVDFMHGMIEALGEGLTREELFQRIVHAAILSTGALSACIFEKTADNRMRGAAVEGLFPPHRPLPEGSRMKLTTRARFIEQVLKSETFDLSEGIVGECARTGKTILIADAVADARVVRHDDPALAVKSLIAAAIVFRGRMIGVLAVVNPADGLPFSETDRSLVQSLAEQAALAVHNSEFLHLQIEKKQLDLDLALASNIQKMLLPHASPEMARLEVDARYIPAQQISGDMYDLIPLAPHRLGVAVADVSGKGIPASLLMAICRTNLRQIAPRHDSPAQVLAALNRAMAADMHQDMFITMLYAVVDTQTNQVSLARAGHELPIFVRRDPVSGVHVTELTASEGMPLGMVDPEMFEAVLVDKTVPLASGDIMVLYTDGVTEAANAEGKEFSGSRLADVVRTLQGRPVKEINDGVLESVVRFSGFDHQRDDLTLVTVKRT